MRNYDRETVCRMGSLPVIGHVAGILSMSQHQQNTPLAKKSHPHRIFRHLSESLGGLSTSAENAESSSSGLPFMTEDLM